MFSAIALALILPAAPVPKDAEKEKIEKLFGKIVDAKGDSEFKLLDGEKLRVLLPADRTRDLCHLTDTAPKLVRRLTGDFVLTVRVTTDLPNDAKPGGTDKAAFLGGGLQFVGSDAKQWLRIGLVSVADAKGTDATFTHENPPSTKVGAGYGLCLSYTGMQGQSHLMRFTRRGQDVALKSTPDGKEWHSCYATDTCPKGDLTVALYAHHSSDKARCVTFSEFSVTPLKEEEKK